jgi:hypothetical protein
MVASRSGGEGIEDLAVTKDFAIASMAADILSMAWLVVSQS